MEPLYKINEEMQQVENDLEQWAIDHEGDITDFPLNDRMDTLEGDKKQKIINIGILIKNRVAEKEMIEKEIKQLQKRLKPISNDITFLTDYVYPDVGDKEKITDPKVIISKRFSEYVFLDLPDKVPTKFINKEIVKTPDKVEIKKHLKSLANPPKWGHMQDNYSLQIK